MKKLSLNPDQLRVESFATQAVPDGRGTVAAHAGTVGTCPVPTAQPWCGTVMRLQSCASSCTQDPEICPAF
jgi:hypothetical protein